MVVKQSTSLPEKNEFVAISYDCHVVTFRINDETQIEVIKTFTNLIEKYRYIRQCCLSDGFICFIAEDGHYDSAANMAERTHTEPNNLVICSY